MFKSQKETNYLKFRTMRGYAHQIPNSILLTTYPGIGIIYFIQCSVRFFDGHSFKEIYRTENHVNTIALKGQYLAIGQSMLKGQLTTTTVINMETKEIKTFKYQKTLVTMLSLSAEAKYLCSVGSSDPTMQEFLIIDVQEVLEFGFKTLGEESFEINNQKISCVCFSNKDPNLFALIFRAKLVFYKIEADDKIIKKVIKSHKIREFSMGLFQPRDIFCYVTSKNGDISEINIKQSKEVRVGPKRRVIISGIKHIRFVQPDRIIVTGSKGYICLIELKQMRVLKEVSINQQIMSLTQFEGDLGFISTAKASIYVLDAATLDIKQFYICHASKIQSICFLEGYSQIFASCAGNQILLWKNLSLNPIIRIALPGLTCHSLNLPKDGASIVSGWSDETIRFFNPKTGKKINQIANAHNGKITALASNKSSDRLYSGGEDGRIRSWKIDKQKFGIIDNIFTGHRSQVHYLEVREDQLYSCSEDGTFAVWNIVKGEKTAMASALSFVRKVIPIDEYSVYCIGSGPNIVRIAKNDGRTLEKMYIGGSWLSDCATIKLRGDGSQTKAVSLINTFFAYGGSEHQVVLKYVNGFNLEQSEVQTQEKQTFGEVTSLKFAPDSNSLIIGTADGTLICYQFKILGFAVQNEAHV